MKQIINLVLIKQWKQYTILLLLLFITVGMIFLIEEYKNSIFKMPIAVQDLDESQSSKNMIKSLEQSKYIDVIKIREDEIYLEDIIQKKSAILAFQIPKGYEHQLNKNDIKDALPLYYKEGFIGEIALEVTSRAIYEQQIPVIIEEHLNKVNQTVEKSNIILTYEKKTPHSKMTHRVVQDDSQFSIHASIYVALILLVGCSQVILHQRLKQNSVLERLKLLHQIHLKIQATYILSHVCLLFMLVFLFNTIMLDGLNVNFYIFLLLTLTIYEIGLSTILFKVHTISHKLFMSLLWSLVISIAYLFIQI